MEDTEYGHFTQYLTLLGENWQQKWTEKPWLWACTICHNFKGRKEEFSVNYANCSEGSVTGKIRCKKWDCTDFQELFLVKKKFSDSGFEPKDLMITG